MGPTVMMADKLIKRVGNGATDPYLVKCSDGELYYVKFAQNPQGVRALVNEYVAHRLATLVRLPVPPMHLIEVTPEFVSLYGEHVYCPIDAGLHFGSQGIRRAAPVTPRVLPKMANLDIIPSLLLFDHWVFNTDRDCNRGNLIIDTEDMKIVVIDHTHVFELGTIWDEHQLRLRTGQAIQPLDMTGHMYRKLVPFVSGNNPFGTALQRFQAIKRQDIAEAVNSVPDEWNCTQSEKNVLCEYLVDRHSMIRTVPQILRMQLPLWKGGA